MAVGGKLCDTELVPPFYCLFTTLWFEIEYLVIFIVTIPAQFHLSAIPHHKTMHISKTLNFAASSRKKREHLAAHEIRHVVATFLELPPFPPNRILAVTCGVLTGGKKKSEFSREWKTHDKQSSHGRLAGKRARDLFR